MAKRMSGKWKDRHAAAKIELTRAAGRVTYESGVQVSDAFMAQFAMIKVAEMIKNGMITEAEILAARREEISGLPVRA